MKAMIQVENLIWFPGVWTVKKQKRLLKKKKIKIEDERKLSNKRIYIDGRTHRTDILSE